jgi:hypothetical protein
MGGPHVPGANSSVIMASSPTHQRRNIIPGTGTSTGRVVCRPSCPRMASTSFAVIPSSMRSKLAIRMRGPWSSSCPSMSQPARPSGVSVPTTSSSRCRRVVKPSSQTYQPTRRGQLVQNRSAQERGCLRRDRHFRIKPTTIPRTAPYHDQPMTRRMACCRGDAWYCVRQSPVRPHTANAMATTTTPVVADHRIYAGCFFCWLGPDMTLSLRPAQRTIDRIVPRSSQRLNGLSPVSLIEGLSVPPWRLLHLRPAERRCCEHCTFEREGAS